MKNLKISLFTFFISLCCQISFSQFQAATIYFPRAGANIPDVPVNFNYYTSNNPIDHINANFNSVSNTKGARYIFNNWAKGFVITTTGARIQNDSLLFNFDKIKNSLLLRRQDSVVLELNKDQINNFSLTEDSKILTFEKIPTINLNSFQQILATKENGYKFCKSIITTFEKADFHTDGLMESGKAYDEYVDKYVYYIIMPDNSYKTIELKSKSLKSMFQDNSKFKEFTSQNGGKIDESYVANLVDYLNN